MRAFQGLQTQISTFPVFTDIDIKMKPYFDELLRLTQPMASEYTFTNIFIWRHLYKFKVSLIGHNLCIKGVDRDGEENLMLIASDPDAYIEAVRNILDVYKQTHKILNLFRVEERYVDLLKQFFPSVLYELDPDNADYIYLTSDLIELKGRKYDGKRNHIKRFKQKYMYEYMSLTPELIDECMELTEKWYNSKNDPSLQSDVIATKEALKYFTELNVKGGAILIDGHVRAFSIAEPLNSNTAVIHIEKYDPAYDGISQTINQQLCEHECSSYKYINREQDLGNQGLRKAKLSYHPVVILNKYKIHI
ncbi:MAG: DUF2156 domain-containing protein [bacterium]